MLHDHKDNLQSHIIVYVVICSKYVIKLHNKMKDEITVALRHLKIIESKGDAESNATKDEAKEEKESPVEAKDNAESSAKTDEGKHSTQSTSLEAEGKEDVQPNVVEKEAKEAIASEAEAKHNAEPSVENANTTNADDGK